MRRLAQATADETTGWAGRRFSRAGQLGMLTTLALLFAIFAGAASAQAAPRYFHLGELSDAGISEPGDIAVDSATGNVLVVVPGANVVRVYDSGGVDATLLTEFGTGELSSPYSIAVDPISGDVYVTDVGNGRIARYESNGAPTPTYSLDAGYTGPDSTEIGSFASQLAVDPTSGDLLVADRGKNEVRRFGPAGNPDGGFNGETTGGAFSALWDIAAAPNGDVYVIANGYREFGDVIAFQTKTFHLGPAGEAKGELITPNTPEEAQNVAVDPGSGKVLLTSGNAYRQGFGGRPAALNVFEGGTLVQEISYQDDLEPVFRGLAVDGQTGRAYQLTSTFFGLFGNDGAQVFVLGDLAFDAPSQVTPSSAHLSGSVNPRGLPTSVHFEYSPDAGETWASTPDVAIGSGVGAVPVQADLTGLAAPHYRLRLVAENAEGTIVTERQLDLLFAENLQATRLTTSSARLRAKIYSAGSLTSYRFEYGLDSSYGSFIPATPAFAGNDVELTTRDVGGLSPSTTYHFRITVSNETGTFRTPDSTFTTPATDPVVRGYEMVSPVDKNGLDVALNRALPARLSEDGNSLVFSAAGSFPGASTSLVGTMYRAKFGTSGWSTSALDVGQTNFGDELRLIGMGSVSRDQSHSIVSSRQALTPGATPNGFNVYLRDDDSGALQLISSEPTASSFYEGSATTFGTADFSRLFFFDTAALTPDAPETNEYKLYEFAGGTLSLASVYDNGEPMQEEIEFRFVDDPEAMLSEDGSRLFITRGGWAGGLVEDGALYVRENGETLPISVSRRSGETGQVKPGLFLDASKDGSVVYFTSFAALTDQSYPGSAYHLYRYDFDSDQLTDIAPTQSGPLGLSFGARKVIASDDGNRVYFEAGAKLTPDAVAGARNFYVWDEGELKLVTILKTEQRQVTISPNGRYAAWTTYDQTTGYDNRNDAICPQVSSYGNPAGLCAVIYVYDSQAEKLSCASCNESGAPPAGHTQLGGGSSLTANGEIYDAVTDDGRVFFDSRDRLVPEDVNGRYDVYQWQDGEQGLISTGTSVADSWLGVVAPNGDVFFGTSQPLVGQDTDENIDIYLARLGGSRTNQDGTAPPEPCIGESCRGPSSSAPAEGSPATTAPGPSGNAQPNRSCLHERKKKKKRAGKGKRRAGEAAAAKSNGKGKSKGKKPVACKGGKGK